MTESNENINKHAMQKLNIPLMCTLLLLSLVVCPILYIYVGPALNNLQLETLKIIGIVAGCSALLCFTLGEITGNNSQVDKIWSLLPIAYCWIIAVKGGMHPRLVVMAVLATLWGIRLTYNFARKGAYKLKFWEGEEDYRWEKVRALPFLQNRAVWMAFDLFFISGYQNALILMFTFPALVCMGSSVPFGWVDVIATILMFGFIVYETVADEQQWKFQGKKWAMIKSGKKLEELPAPYNKGFNTIGLWNVSRHPNYMAEQAIWVSLYIFSIGAGVGIINWSMIGALLLIVLFTASTNLVEGISGDKYPEYAEYCKKVNKFFPGRKYIK
jgi:steroid 5-alpha reductase family enzyme